MPLLLLNNWKLALAGFALLTSFAAGWHLKALTVDAAHDREMRAQARARESAEAEVNSLAAALEAEKLAGRQHEAELNQRWSAELEKPHPICNLSAGTVLVLKDATRPLPR